MNTRRQHSPPSEYTSPCCSRPLPSPQAESRIDRVLNDLEKQADVETTYSERRTMKKHELYRTTTMMTFTRQEYYNKLAKAFEEERSNAVSAIKNSGQRTYRFEDKKSQSSYTNLVRRQVYRRQVVEPQRCRRRGIQRPRRQRDACPGHRNQRARPSYRSTAP